MTVGVFAAVAQAMWNFTGEFQYGVIQMAKGLEEGRLFDDKIESFLNLELEEASCPEDMGQKNPLCFGGEKEYQPMVFQSLILKDIWYRYTTKDPYVLKGVNLEVKENQKMALVGQNGSGKTTLTKILLGLIAPERGEIWLNGELITEQNRSLLRKVTSAVFQDYIKYSLSLPESLNLGKEGKPVSEEMMDEPTAALDPIAEAAVYDLIYEKNKQRTVLLVTHRLGAVVHADCIYVLKNGKISESGNHNELLHLQKDYAELFQTQKRWYQEKPESGELAEIETSFQEEGITKEVCNE